MASSPIKLTVGATAYDLGSQEFSRESGDLDAPADWSEVARFLRAVADTLDDGYTLRKSLRLVGGCDGE